MTKWGDITLCEPSDIESVAGAFVNLAISSGSSHETSLQAACDEAKEEIYERLLEVTPDIYANSLASFPGYPASLNDLLLDATYQWETVDQILDRIANPEVLRTAAIECAKWKMKDKLAEKASVTDIDNTEAYRKEADKQEQRFLDRYERAWRRLQFDLNQDGIVQPAERTRTRNSIRIV